MSGAQSKSQFEKTAIIAMGQAAGFVFAFFIPVFLSRRLSVESYGTYKQIILIQWFFLMTLHIGLDSGLFYFVKRHPREAAVFSLNAVGVEFLLAGCVALLIFAFRYPFAALFHNPDLVALALPLGELILFTIPAQHLEHYFMLLDKVRFNFLSFSISEFLKVVSVLVGFYFFNSLAVVIYLFAAIGFLRCLLLVTMNLYFLRRDQIPLSRLRGHLPKQFGYGLPLGISQIFAICYKMDRFVIATLFDVRQFTLYSVGSLEVPLVPNVTNTMSDLMSFDMVEAHAKRDYSTIKYLWQSTKRKIALLQIPIAIYLITFAPLIMTFIYSNKYTESAPYFRVFMLIFIVNTFECDILFRTFADNRRFLRVQVLSSLGGLSMTIGFAYLYGPIGALIGKLVGDTVAVLWKLQLAKGLLRVPGRELFLWGELLRNISVSVLSALAASFAVRYVGGSVFIHVVTTLVVFGATFAVAGILGNVIKADELDYLKTKIGGRLLLFNLLPDRRN